jgi:hypothetical protein
MRLTSAAGFGTAWQHHHAHGARSIGTAHPTGLQQTASSPAFKLMLPPLSMAVRISGPLVSSMVAMWCARLSSITWRQQCAAAVRGQTQVKGTIGQTDVQSWSNTGHFGQTMHQALSLRYQTSANISSGCVGAACYCYPCEQLDICHMSKIRMHALDNRPRSRHHHRRSHHRRLYFTAPCAASAAPLRAPRGLRG